MPLEVRVRTELALLLVATGRASEAEPHLTRLREIVAGGEDWRGAAGAVAPAEGAVAGALGQHAQADEHFARAVQVLRRYGVVLEEAEALISWGRILLAHEDWAGGLTRLDEAAALYARIGAGARWRERIAGDQQRAREALAR